MIKILSTAWFCLCYICLLIPARGDLVSGRILCDANDNKMADVSDVGLAGVKVEMRSEAGGFSNSAVTLADGAFSMTIPNFDALAYRRDPLSQSYVESLTPTTLPADATVIFPQPALGSTPVYYINPAGPAGPLTYVSAAGVSTNGDWLLSSAGCRPVSQTNTCRLTGSGSIVGASNRVEHSFSGSLPGKVKKNGFRQGNWTHDARALNLRFRSTEIDAVTCAQGTGGVVAGTNEVVNAIEFSGRGTLRNLHGKRTMPVPVFFTAWAQDAGKAKGNKGEYYVRIYDGAGTTWILVSADPANPENIAPVPLTKGRFRVRAAQL
jgi:hypothetical protein